MKFTEIFSSVEGEGVNCGKPTTFIRFFGCDIKCSYCDTEYSWKPEYAEKTIDYTIDEVIELCTEPIISFTGGNPLLHIDNILTIIQHLDDYYHKSKYYNLEDPGAHISYRNMEVYDKVHMISMDIKSPNSVCNIKSEQKLLKYIIKEYGHKMQLKMPIFCESDIIWLSSFNDVAQYVQEMVISPGTINGQYSVSGLTMMDWCKKYKVKARFIPQIHKLLDLE